MGFPLRAILGFNLLTFKGKGAPILEMSIEANPNL